MSDVLQPFDAYHSWSSVNTLTMSRDFNAESVGCAMFTVYDSATTWFARFID